LSPIKDHAVMLEALRIVRTRVPAHLHLVGDGELRDELERLAHALGVGEHVTFHGSVPHHALPPYYRAADLVVVSSTFESQCMAALEAAACGRPLAGTSVGIVPELEGVPVVPAGNPHALSYAIRALAVNPARRAALGRTLRTTVEARFDVEHTSGHLRALYEEVGDVAASDK
jgi:glycosyltransferase involved in cell wall biosynthesis